MPTSDPIEFYFDFMSPYAYLGSIGIEQVAAKHDRSVDWRPILLGVTVYKVMGLKALADTPLKRDYVRHDVPRFARYLGIPFSRAKDQPMYSLHAARAFVWLKDQDVKMAKTFAKAIFDAQWAQATDMSTADAVAGMGHRIGVEPASLSQAMRNESVKTRLKEEVSIAIDKGVFGTPTFIVDREMFWGADRLDMVDSWIETGGW